MKKILFMIAMCLTAGVVGAQTKDVVLEKKIIRAVQPVTQKLKYVLQTGENININQESSVYFTVKSACEGSVCCDGAQYCTHLAIYYDKQKNCRRDFREEGLGFVDTSRSGGNGRNYYNMVHKNICYVISTHKKKDAEALARAIKSKI